MESSVVSYLLEKGYQVWLGNNRGNKYSCTNDKLDNSSKEFWDYSFQELAEIDFPLFLQTVLEKTGKEKITVMGHSQGGTQIFAALAEFPELQNSIGKGIFLSLINRTFYWVGSCTVCKQY
jgi:lysosomal acid lipase/cholesteryl ester hydrolase